MLTDKELQEVNERFKYYDILQQAAFAALRAGDHGIHRFLTDKVHEKVENETRNLKSTA